MISDELKQLIELKEGYSLEFKESPTKEIKKEICAFVNASGGKILIGVKDNGEIKGLNINNKLLSQVQDFISQLTPKLDVSYKVENNILIIDVPEGKKEEKPYSIDNKFYLREGPNSQTLNREEIKSFFVSGNSDNFDEKLNTNFNFKRDFNTMAFEEFTNLSKINLNSSDTTAILKNLHIMSSTYIKNAGVLLFCKNITDFFLSAKVTCVLFQGNSKTKVIDRKDFTSSIIKNYTNVINYLKDKLNTEYIIDDAGPRKEILELPEDALREAIVNALVHKDYTSNAHVQINIYKDSIEIVNPAKLPDMSFEKVLKGSYPKNPLLLSLLYRTEIVENIGSGIKRINDYLKEYRLEDAKFEYNGLWFITTFQRPNLEKQSYQQRLKVEAEKIGKLNGTLNGTLNGALKVLFNYICENPNRNATTIAQELNKPLDTIKKQISKLLKQDLIERVGSKKTGGYMKK